MRIAIGGFQHETNTFSRTMTGIADFTTASTWPGLLAGEALLRTMTPDDPTSARNIPIAGFIAAANMSPHTLVPTTWCAAGPGGYVTREAFETIVAMLVTGIRQASADAVYLDLHGAMAAEHIDDADAEILQRVRDAIGPDIPLVASLDLHANVSQAMIDCADILVAYRTYPHVDMAETGAKAFAWIAQRLDGAPRPVAAWMRVPYLIPMCWQSTDDAPARDLYGMLAECDTGTVDLAHASFAMGFPAADVEKCGPTVWAYDATADGARTVAQGLLDAVIAAESAFAGEILDANTAVAKAMAMAYDSAMPVVIADAQDNPGAGGSADTTSLLKALVASHAQGAVLGLLVDAKTAAQAHAAGVGTRITVCLGGQYGIKDDTPFVGEVVVERLHNGEVAATGSVFKGYRLTLGQSACLAIGGVRVIVVSQPVQLLDLALLRFIGIVPEEQRIIVVKSTVHFRADFAPIARAILVCAAPGAFLLDPGQLPWTKLPASIRKLPGQLT